VVGGGLAGISCAYHLPVASTLYERESELGGTARSYSADGFTFDYTGHLLHLHNDYTKDLIRKLLKGNIFSCTRNAWIYSKKVYTRYPFQANLFGLPPRVIEDCVAGLWRSRQAYGAHPIPQDRPLDFAEWSVRLFGEGITDHFMRPYNEKLWRVSGREMTAEWCGSFVPQPKLEEVIAGSFNDNSKLFGYNTTFLYPKRGGIQELSKAFGRRLSDVRLGASLDKVFWKAKRVTLSSGETRDYDALVSTIPLVELLKRLDPFPAELKEPLSRLQWTSVMCVNLGVGRAGISDKSWIYFPEKDFVFYRVGFPMNFTPHVVPAGCSSMYVEYSYKPGEKTDRALLLKKILAGLRKAGILRADDKILHSSFIPIPYAYVVYNPGRTEALAAIFHWLKSEARALSIGRYGGWK
jgi:protoporphyrinogen oxidase